MSYKEFKQAYIECALWSSCDDNGESMDYFDVGDLSPALLRSITIDCRNFYVDQSTVWQKFGWTDEQAGHDFWLTRNGHGAGFWDRGKDLIGYELTKDAKMYSSVDLYIGDDGRVYG